MIKPDKLQQELGSYSISKLDSGRDLWSSITWFGTFVLGELVWSLDPEVTLTA